MKVSLAETKELFMFGSVFYFQMHMNILNIRWLRPSREPPTDYHKVHTLRYQHTAIIPFIGQSIIRPSRPQIKKHLTKADTITLYYTNPPRLLNGGTDNQTTSCGTIPHSAKTSTPISVTDSSH